MRVLFDTDVLLTREPFLESSVRALDTVVTSGVEGFVAAHAVTTVSYFVGRAHGATRVRPILASLLVRLKVAAATEGVVRSALTSPIVDFEDAVGHASVLEANVDIIVSRNFADYEGGSIRALSPADFLTVLTANDE